MEYIVLLSRDQVDQTEVYHPRLSYPVAGSNGNP
jgi:hypothetical protein